MNVTSLLALLSLTAIACAPQAAPPPVSSNVVATSAPVPPPPAPRQQPSSRAYRLDFVLSTTDGAAAPTTMSFTMNLVEHDAGELTIGKNVALTPGTATPSPRQDVGLHVKAALKNVGDDLYLETQLELSAFEPPTTIRKVVEHGDVLAIDGKQALVTSIEDDKKHYQLTVTPTKLR